MNLVEKFTEKYGVNPIKLVEDANLEFFGVIKSLGLKRLLEDYIEKKGLKIDLTDEFFVELVECFAEAGEKFPESQKAPEIVGATFEIPNQKVGAPKSKGTLENFKDIVGKDELRPVMQGVYVSEDGFLVGTDAHKLIKFRNNEFSQEKGKIIDLSKYIKSKGKIIDFIDGKYPNYEAVIPKDNLEQKALSTYAFYNLAKSAQEVKRLTSNAIFNINLKLKTTDDKLEVYGFSYIIMLEALTFAMANGWDFFTLEYSTPSRAVVLNFGDGNIALVMPSITKDNEPRGTKAMTTEEVEENYRLGISKQKASKPKATQPARPSAFVSSEPFKKFEGELSDTTYIHRSQIDSIKLVSGEVLGKNDIIDGFYRVNKKMATGGGIYSSDEMYVLKVYDLKGNLLDDSIRFRERNERRAKEHAIYYYEDDMRDKYGSDLKFTIELAKPKMAHGGSMYANGGMVEHGLRMGDTILSTTGTNVVEVRDRDGEHNLVNLNVGKRIAKKDFTTESSQGEYKDFFKMSYGGSMYASGGKIDPIDMAEVESSAIFYTEKGKWSPEPTIEKFENQIKEYQEMKRALDNKEIRPSQVIGTGFKPQYVRPLAYRWIEERTLIAKRAIEILKERMGGEKSSSHEVGDRVTFNSVMGGTKTGTIISKIGDEGFRIATSDGFATIKKSAIV